MCCFDVSHKQLDSCQKIIVDNFTGRQDLAKLLSMGKKKKVCPPGIYTSKPYTGSEGTQYEEDGMEHLDQEVNTSICKALILFQLFPVSV